MQDFDKLRKQLDQFFWANKITPENWQKYGPLLVAKIQNINFTLIGRPLNEVIEDLEELNALLKELADTVP